MQNSQHQGAWDRPAADLQAPGEGNGECPREEPTLIRPWGGLSPAPGEEGSVLGECRPELCPERGLLAVMQRGERVQQGKNNTTPFGASPFGGNLRGTVLTQLARLQPRDGHGPRLRQSNRPCGTLGRSLAVSEPPLRIERAGPGSLGLYFARIYPYDPPFRIPPHREEAPREPGEDPRSTAYFLEDSRLPASRCGKCAVRGPPYVLGPHTRRE